MWFMSRLSILILCSEKFRGCNCNFGLPTGSVDSFKNLPSIHHYIRRAKSILIKIENLVYIVRTFICYVHLFSWNAVHLGCFPTHSICATVKWELVQTGQGYHYLPGMHWMNLPPQLSKWRSDLCCVDINSHARESNTDIVIFIFVAYLWILTIGCHGFYYNNKYFDHHFSTSVDKTSDAVIW